MLNNIEINVLRSKDHGSSAPVAICTLWGWLMVKAVVVVVAVVDKRAERHMINDLMDFLNSKWHGTR